MSLLLVAFRQPLQGSAPSCSMNWRNGCSRSLSVSWTLPPGTLKTAMPGCFFIKPRGSAVVYLVGLLQVIPWCRYHGKRWDVVPLLLLWYTANGLPGGSRVLPRAAAWYTPRGIAGLL